MHWALLLSACGLMWAMLVVSIVSEKELAMMAMNAICRRYVPPPRYEEAVTTLEPAPFADLFGDSDNIFGQVCPWHMAEDVSTTITPAAFVRVLCPGFTDQVCSCAANYGSTVILCQQRASWLCWTPLDACACTLMPPLYWELGSAMGILLHQNLYAEQDVWQKGDTFA